MNTYYLTAHGHVGWRDIRVNNAPDMLSAIAVAERATGCMVSHGRGDPQPDFLPGVVIDAATGDVQTITDPDTGRARTAKPQVMLGPPDVLRAISQALKDKPKAPPKRKTGAHARTD